MRVLVAEDNARMARLLRRSLEENGYAVDVVGDGPDALWMGEENQYAAIVLDVMLPSLDGFEVCRRLREHGQWAPVVMLTARTAVADRVEGLDAGADDYLAKPFSFAELAARLRALVRRGAGERPAIVESGDLRLDPAGRHAWRGDTELSLTPKEFALLELFLRNSGVVLTRTRILESVWDFSYDPTSNVVDQYVAYLRRKVDKPFGRSDIETLRGSGYRLRDQREGQAAGGT
jgi:two-component system OmpR family response regulator